MWNYQPAYLYSSTWTLHVLKRILTRSQSWHARLFAICALGALSARLGWWGPSGLRSPACRSSRSSRWIWLCSRTGLVWQNPMVYHGLYMIIWVSWFFSELFISSQKRGSSVSPGFFVWCRQCWSAILGLAIKFLGLQKRGEPQNPPILIQWTMAKKYENRWLKDVKPWLGLN